MAQGRYLDIVVTDLQNQPIPNVRLTVTGDPSLSGITDGTGKTRLLLQSLGPTRSEVELNLYPKGFVFISPWDKRIQAPLYQKVPLGPIRLILAKRGSKQILEDARGITAVLANINVAGGAIRIDQSTAEKRRRAALSKTAREFGLDSKEIDSAIREWGKKTNDPYLTGLVALYTDNYSEAEIALANSLQLKEADLENARVNARSTAVHLGQTLYGQGKYSQSREIFRELSKQDPKDYTALNELGKVLVKMGDYSEAQAKFAEASSLVERSIGRDHPTYAAIIDNLGGVYVFQRDYQLAESKHREALAIRKKWFGQDHPAVAASYSSLGWLYYTQGKFDNAEKNYLVSLEINKKVLGAEDVEVAAGLMNLGLIYMVQDRYADAEIALNQSVAIKGKVLSTDQPAYLATLDMLADLYVKQERYSEAESLLKHLLGVREKTIGINRFKYQQIEVARFTVKDGIELPVSYLTTLTGELVAQLHETKKFQQVFREGELQGAGEVPALRLTSEITEFKSRDRAARLMIGFGAGKTEIKTHIKLTDRATGQVLYEGDVDSKVINGLFGGGSIGVTRGLAKEVAMANQMLNKHDIMIGADQPAYLATLDKLADLYVKQERYSEAEQSLKKTLDIREELFERDYSRKALLEVLIGAASGAHAMSAGTLGAPGGVIMAASTSRMPSANRSEYLATLDKLAGLYVKQDRYSEAEQLLELALVTNGGARLTDRSSRRIGVKGKSVGGNILELNESTLGVSPENLARIEKLTDIYSKQGKYSKAEQLLKQALAISEKALGREHPSTNGRFALVIGNSKYEQSPLTNTAKDANDLVETLKELGFDVLRGIDVNREQMVSLIEEFGVKVKRGDVGLFYFAGHGMQVNGENYLIPIDAIINSEPEIKLRSVSVSTVLSKMENAHNRVNIVILDACQNNSSLINRRSASRGLAQITAPSGFIIAFATQAGAIASEIAGSNGSYTSELLTHLRIPGLSVEEIFKRTRTGLMYKTNNQQVPWESNSLKGDFYLNGRRTENANVHTKENIAKKLEDVAWARVQQSASIANYQAYLNDYPAGRYAETARRAVLESVLTITIPDKDGASVGHELIVKGKAIKTSKEDHIWVLVHRSDFGQVWWPQREAIPDVKTGEWNARIVLGGAQDVGYEFEIAVIMVNETEHLKLRSYWEKAMRSASSPPIEMPTTMTPPQIRKVRKVSHN